MNKKILILFSLIFAVSTILGCVKFQGGCTKELRICPDGTGVGRTTPNCEFAPCPDIKPDSNVNYTSPAFGPKSIITEAGNFSVINKSSEFYLIQGETAKVTNYRGMQIKLDSILENPLCADVNGTGFTIQHCASFVKVIISTPGGCGQNADPRCLGFPGDSQEFTISIGETAESQGVALKLLGIEWREVSGNPGALRNEGIKASPHAKFKIGFN